MTYDIILQLQLLTLLSNFMNETRIRTQLVNTQWHLLVYVMKNLSSSNLLTIHTYMIICSKKHTITVIWQEQSATQSSVFVGLWLRLRGLKIPRLRLWVKVGHWLLNLCDCDSVLSERCRQTNAQDLKKIIIIYGIIIFKTGENRYGLCGVLSFGRTQSPGF